MRFTFALGDDLRLALRTLDTVDEMHDLTLANLDRLRRWEQWALFEQTREATAEYTRAQLAGYIAGTTVPTVILAGDAIVGSASLRLNTIAGTAELGYWIDAASEGRGAVTRACAALLTHAEEAGARRVEIRTAVDNTRSARVAERLGFTCEDVLVKALPLDDVRLDVAVYARTTAG